MKKQLTAQSYANAVVSIGKSNKIDFANELTTFVELLNFSSDLENVLFLEIFTIEEKKKVLEEIFKKCNFDKLFQNFVFYLIEEKRISLLPLIFKEVIILDDHEKGFIRGTIEGKEQKLGVEEQNLIENHLRKKLEKKPILNYEHVEKLTAGFKITVEDLQLDASIDSQFESLKKSILGE